MRQITKPWCVKNDGSLLFCNAVMRYIAINAAKYILYPIDEFYYGIKDDGTVLHWPVKPPHFKEFSLKEFIEITGAKEELALIVTNELLQEHGKFTGRQLKTILYEKFGLTISAAHTREILHGLRCSGKLPLLVANTSGYWIATTTMEVQKYREFLQQRAKAFFELSAAIRDQAELKFGKQLDLEIK